MSGQREPEGIDFLLEAGQIRDEIIALRRAIHQYPELGGEEEETAKRVESYLGGLGIKTRRSCGTGVIGLLEGAATGPVVAFRADMDALRIEEKTGLPYASKRPGLMHACGHDAHTAALLSAARLLAARRSRLPGQVKFFFQPDEEGDGGACQMIADGAMENPRVDAVFGAHVDPLLPAGHAGFLPGKAYAASNIFRIIIKGKSTHAAKPHLGVDAIAVASQVVSALQQYTARNVNPLDSVIISVCTMHGSSGQINVISEEVEMGGVIRTLGAEMRRQTVAAVKRIVSGVAGALGAEARIEITDGHSGITNDPGMTLFAEETAIKLLGKERVIRIEKPTMGSEDFGLFLERAPGCFYSFGVGNPQKGITAPGHNDRFNIDEDALPALAALHAAIAWRYLAEKTARDGGCPADA